MAGVDELVGLWDSGPFDYGAMESSRFALLADGTGWGVWENAAGGMELTVLTWRRLAGDAFAITELQLVSGTWDAARPGVLTPSGPPTNRDDTTRFQYRIVRERPPLADRETPALRLDRSFQFSTAYAFVRPAVAPDDAPVIVD